jgi:hypothetical protein
MAAIHEIIRFPTRLAVISEALSRGVQQGFFSGRSCLMAEESRYFCLTSLHRPVMARPPSGIATDPPPNLTFPPTVRLFVTGVPVTASDGVQ